jgi:GT2 family glycosyltransferase
MQTSRKRCDRAASNDDFFLSLVDYMNNLFTSYDHTEIIKFFDSFQNKEELVEWMRRRPKGAVYVHEVEGDNDIIVVIPTADFNGKYATECKDNLFKGLHMVFVESGEPPDPYFNFAHNANIGIRKALEYDPKWIIISNDDMYKVEDISLLIEQLKEIDSKKIGGCFLHPETIYYSRSNSIVRIRSIIRRIVIPLRFLFPGEIRDRFYVMNKFSSKSANLYLIWENKSRTASFQYKALEKIIFMLYDFLFDTVLEFNDMIAFGIFSSDVLRNFLDKDGFAFDETFINCNDDSDISIRLRLSDYQVTRINFRIGYHLGSTLGWNYARRIRDLASIMYLSWKIENGLYPGLVHR